MSYKYHIYASMYETMVKLKYLLITSYDTILSNYTFWDDMTHIYIYVN